METSLPVYRFVVRPSGENDPRSTGLLDDAHALGFAGLARLECHDLYFIEGQLSPAALDRLGCELLCDPLAQAFSWQALPAPEEAQDGTARLLEAALRPGVTDPVAEQITRAAHELGLSEVTRAATGLRFWFNGEALDEDTLHLLARRLLANPVIQHYAIGQISPSFPQAAAASAQVETLRLRGIDDDALLALSQERRAALDLAEMRAVQRYCEAEGRDLSDVEFEMIAQTWSEHCVHKTFKALVEVENATGAPTQINNIMRSYIRAASEQIAAPWVRSMFVDNAGIIDYDGVNEISFKVETHNHPSAIEPFGGANTGIGGVIRDILGVSAKPVAATDVLCFGPQDLPLEQLPAGVLHPRRILSGVVAGVQDYGNKIGIPTVSGGVLFDPGYTANPLVFCGCLGIAPIGSHPRQPRSGDRIIVIGGRTGRDGLRGATFSSMTMDAQTGEVSGASVQIGAPITEKGLIEVVTRARDAHLYTAITDCGAGGLSSAVGEMTSTCGGEVELQDVRLKYPGLAPWEIWLSEAQERMVLASPPKNLPALRELCATFDIELTDIGQFNASGRIVVRYGNQAVLDLDNGFLHHGLPQRNLRARITQSALSPAPMIKVSPQQIGQFLLDLLAHPDIASKESIIRLYDHEVQGGTLLKPLTGAQNDGPADACVLRPAATQGTMALALSAGINPQYGKTDPYRMAYSVIDEAVRNAVAVGADPARIAILDNFCWGDPTRPETMGDLLLAAQACYDAALLYKTPFISGKDSFNNEYLGADGLRHSIPPTLLISGLGLLEDAAQAVSLDLKSPGSLLYLVGEFNPVFGGSHFNLVHGLPPEAGQVPAPSPRAPQVYAALHAAMHARLVRACHDLSEGGLAVAAAEMCIAGRAGLELDLNALPCPPLETLFGETNGCLLCEVRPEDAAQFETLFNGLPFSMLGMVQGAKSLTVRQSAENLFTLEIESLVQTWKRIPNPNSGTKPPGIVEPSKDKVSFGSFALPRNSDHPTMPAMRPKALILQANGTNRDPDVALALELAGAAPEIVPLNLLRQGNHRWQDYQMLVLAGGFSYADALGAGKLLALDLQAYFADEVNAFVESGKPVLGICNGFQALVKAGILPGGQVPATLTFNRGGHFECRWVRLLPISQNCVWTRGLEEGIECPVAHGEGNFQLADPAALATLRLGDQIALAYAGENASPAGSAYPANPNGSLADIAGVCNPRGNVLGLMPHPENHIFPHQHPQWTRRPPTGSGLRLFQNAVKTLS